MNIRKVGAFIGSILAFLIAWLIMAFTFLPNAIAEPGSQNARPLLPLILVIPVALGLLYVSWRLLRFALSARHRLYFAAAAAAIMIAVSVPRKIKPPENRQPIGGSWYVVAQKSEMPEQNVKYALYRKNDETYERLQIEVKKYQFKAPDCVEYWGFDILGGGHYQVCGIEQPRRLGDQT